MIQRKRFAFLLAAVPLVSIGACQTLRFPRQLVTAPIRTDSAQIGVRHGGYTYRAEIGLVFTNTTPNPVSAAVRCPPFQWLEKKVQDNWVRATGYNNCLTSAGPPGLTIESGQSYRGLYQLLASDRGHAGWPELQVDSIEGIYRLRWNFREGTDAYDENARTVEGISNEFRIVLSPK